MRGSADTVLAAGDEASPASCAADTIELDLTPQNPCALLEACAQGRGEDAQRLLSAMTLPSTVRDGLPADPSTSLNLGETGCSTASPAAHTYAALRMAEADGSTSLVYAAKRGLTEPLRMLLALGADDAARVLPSNNGALHLAAVKGSVPCVQLLIQAMQQRRSGASVDVTNINGDTPLMFACGFGHLGVAIALIKAGADVCAANVRGLTPLLAAAGGSHAFVMLALLRHAGSVAAGAGTTVAVMLKQRDVDGNGPLHFCCRAGDAAGTQLLLDAGCSIGERNVRGHTPVQEARASRQLACQKLVEEHCATFSAGVDSAWESTTAAAAAPRPLTKEQRRQQRLLSEQERGALAAEAPKPADAALCSEIGGRPSEAATAGTAAPLSEPSSPAAVGTHAQEFVAAPSTPAASQAAALAAPAPHVPTLPASPAPRVSATSLAHPVAATSPPAAARSELAAHTTPTAKTRPSVPAAPPPPQQPQQQQQQQQQQRDRSSGAVLTSGAAPSFKAAMLAGRSHVAAAAAAATPAAAPVPAAARAPPSGGARPSSAGVGVQPKDAHAGSSTVPSAAAACASPPTPASAPQRSAAAAAVQQDGGQPPQRPLSPAGPQQASGAAATLPRVPSFAEGGALCYAEMVSRLQADCAEAAALDIQPEHVVGCGLEALSMSQLEALEAIHHTALTRLANVRLQQAREQERRQAAAQARLAADLHTALMSQQA